jgi:hypothetical protein
MIELIALSILVMCGTASAVTATAGEAAITGRVAITKVLTKKRITLPSYDLRGPVVNSQNADKPPNSDPAVDELSRVVIYVEGPGLRPAPPTHGTLTQRNRRFTPEILVVPVGSSVSFPNEDPIFHNVFFLSEAKPFDLGYYAVGETRAVKFDRAGVVQVYCHIHPDMSAVIFVPATAYWTRPAPNGRFSLSGVPPGAYDLVAWHRSAGFFRRHIAVTEGKVVTEDFVIPVKDPSSAAAPMTGSAP